MSAVLDVRIEVNKNGAIEINKVKREANEAEKSTNRLEKSSHKLASSMSSMALKIGLAVGSLVALKSAFDLGANFVETSAQFEKFETTLTSITGSSAKAKESMAWIQDFTATTPFQLGQVTEGFVKMKAYGLEPMDGTLKTLGDTASAMGKDIVQAVEAMADAVTGENERLKEFGIKASKDGDTIAYAWSDSSGKARNIVIENNKDVIQSTLNAIFNEKYVGAMDAQSKTWDGMVSNIADRWTLFKKDFMDAGLFSYLKGILGVIGDRLGQAFGSAKEGAKTFSDNVIGGIKSIIIGFGNMSDMWNGVKFAFKSIEAVFYGLVAGIGDGINVIGEGWDSMTVALQNGFKGFVDGTGQAFYFMINKLLGGINTLVNGASDGLGGLFEYIGVANPFGTINLSVGEYVSGMETAVASTEKLVNTEWSNGNLKKSLAEADVLLENIINEDGKNGAIEIIGDIEKKVAELNKTEAKGNKQKEDARKHLDKIGAGYGQLDKKAKKSNKERDKALKDAEKATQKLGDSMQNIGDDFASTIAGAFGTVGDEMYQFYNTVSDLMAKASAESIAQSQAEGAGATGSAIAKAGSQAGIYGAIAMAGLLAVYGMAQGGTFDSVESAPELGDIGAKTSDTLVNALDNMLDVQYPMLELTREMTGYLQTISLAFGGVENSLLRSGIDIGGDLFQDTYKKGTLFGGKSTELYGTSIDIEAQTMAELMNGELEAYLDTVTKTVKTKWYGSKKTSYSHKYTDISEDIGTYITDATTSIFDSLSSAGNALGMDLTVEETTRTWVADAEQQTTGIFGSFFNGFGNKIRSGSILSRFSIWGKNVAEQTGTWVEETVTKSLQDELIDIGKFDTTGMSSAEVAQEIQDRFSAQVDAITEKYFGAVKEFQKAGEGLGETLFRVIRNFDQVSHSLDLIDKAVDWRTANIITDVAGGLDAFNQSFSSFTDNFYNDSEKYQMQLKTMTASFRTLGLELPKNNNEFRSLIEGIDTTTDAGASLFAEILSLSDAFAGMTSAGEDLRESTSGYMDEISSFLTSDYSFLTAQGKTDYASMMVEKARNGSSIVSEKDASMLLVEQSLRTARTEEDYNKVAREHLDVLVESAKEENPNKEVVAELKEIREAVTDLEDTMRRALI